ncbi:MAG: serine/threonine-protein kinase PknK, partial [Spirulina sp. DLM2.Bin59]
MGSSRRSAILVHFVINPMFDCPIENNNKLLLHCLLYESEQTLVYRGLRGAEEPLQPVILKLLRSDYPTPEQLHRYQHEYEITQTLKSPGVIQIYGLHPYHNTVFLTLEDIGGQSLAQLPRTLGLEEFFTVAIAITSALSDIHNAGLIHKDLNPSNIIYHPETGQLKIIDFGLAAPQGVACTTTNGSLEGTLAYISPEQTGRLNCPLDSRTDLYALGVTFYQLLTGQLPFPSGDLLELIHCHLARTPTPPHILDPRIPESLSQVVMKLLAKPVTERYQTAQGLQWDLQRCHQGWQGGQQTLTTVASAFPLGEQDHGAQFQLPTQLYGRDRQREKLLNLWRGVVQQELPMALVMVAGGAGVGKTALIQGLYPAITQAQGYFLTGKCDQLQATHPYDVISQALGQWVRHLLSEPDHQLAQWRSRLQTGLSNPGVLVEILPDLALILGPQPPVIPLGMVEAQHRFHRVMGQFLRLLCRPEHPIALFLDDLQWADTATLKLLQVLRQDAQMTSLLVIGAYRDGELSPHHPLRALLTPQSGQGCAIEIPLPPLEGEAIAQFLATALNQSQAAVEPLAHLIAEKTGGNPFFTREFLQANVRDGLIHWNAHQRQWQWDLEAIAAQPSTANVVELMIKMIRQFPPATQRALRYGACFGRHVEVELLAQLLEQSPPATQKALTPAINHALLPDGQQYTFRHDRIQQAAYELLAPYERIKAHYKIALLLIKQQNPRSCPHNIFTIADHCNFGYPIVVTSRIRQQGAELNLQAAQRAQAASAYGAALSYCQAGIALLAPNCWSSQYHLTLNLYTHGADNAYSLGEYDQMAAYLQTIHLHTRAVLDQVKAYDIEIRAQMAKGNPEKAVNSLLHILRRLDLYYNPHPHPLQLAGATVLTILQLWWQSALKVIPTQPQPPQELAALSLITTALPALVAKYPRLYRLLIIRQVQGAMRYGHSPDSAVGYGHFAVWLGNDWGQWGRVMALGRRALEIVDHLPDVTIRGQILWLNGAYLHHWTNHSRDVVTTLQAAYQACLDVGDMDTATAALTASYSHRYYLGLTAVGELQKTLTSPDQTPSLALYQASWQLLAQGLDEHPTLSHETHLYDRLVARATGEVAAPGNDYGRFEFALNKLVLSYWFDDPLAARIHSQTAGEYLESARGTLGYGLWCFYDALTCFALLRLDGSPHLQALWRRAQNRERRLTQWAKWGPIPYRHRLCLVQAERMGHLRQLTAAIRLYDEAIALAAERGYLSELALAYELAARFYLSYGKTLVARAYIQEARY